MASTDTGAALTDAHRLAQARLAMATAAMITRHWTLLDPDRLDAAAFDWLTAVIPVVAQQRTHSILLAASYQTRFRSTEVPDVDDSFVLPPAPPLDRGAVTVSLLTQGPIKVKALVGSGVPLQEALTQARFASALAGTRHSINGGRDLITAATDADPRAHGVRRVCSPDCCSFCALQAVRSYQGLSLAMGPLHDNCNCQPETAFTTGPQDATRQAREFAALYDESQADRRRGSSNPGLNAFRRALEARRRT